MEHVKYLILGAGPAGLSFGRSLKDKGENSFLILEKDMTAGGLCRSTDVDGSPFDIGGGHFLDVKRPEVNAFLFRFMPREEWKLFERDSRIQINGMTIGHPFEANIWQLDIDSQVKYLSSIARAGCNREEVMPEKFVDWIKWKLGDKIAEDYMIPYNRKMFADELNELGTYWLEKLPKVSFEETLLSCLARKPYGKQPGHASFYYPEKYGYGEVWRRLAESMASHILYKMAVSGIDIENRIVTTLSGNSFKADAIITTIPWREFRNISGMPKELADSVKLLKHSAVETRYIPENLETKAQWIYIPSPEVPYHRILVRHNFCAGSKGYWLETRKEKTGSYKDDNYHYLNEYAYPLNTIEKPKIMSELLAFCRLRQVYGLGRWGEHSHYNSDVVVELAMKLSEEITVK